LAAAAVYGQGAAGQSFAASGAAAGIEANAGASSSPDGSQFADGTRAINEGRWADAEAIFTKVAGQHGEHADGALYWKAYAENKQGHSNHAFETCSELGRDFPGSSWIHECGALEIEIHARSGKPAEPKAGDDDDLKLLALNSLMRKNEPRALAEIQEILNGDSSEKLKKEAFFILGTHYSDATYAQIARISYVQGDVRIARGQQNEKVTGATWEKAVADLPLETGFSLATGAGRAEIELEDASTLYLGENSVLSFNDLHTTGGAPYTELALLTGTVSLHVHPYIAGEMFILRTPTDTFVSRYCDRSYVRIGSFLDAMTVTPLKGSGVLHLPGMTKEIMASGRTVTYRENGVGEPAGSDDAGAFSEWDKWVEDRVDLRAAAAADLMKEAGLTVPVPGLAEMKGQGTFFECAPYGTCWEPNGAEDNKQEGDKVSESLRSPSVVARQPAHAMRVNFVKSPGAAAMQATSPVLPQIEEHEFDFPCYPAAIRYRTVRDPVTGRERVIDTTIGQQPLPYRWAVCHAGSWIHRRHRYVWVAGPKRHHLDPVRWVKSGHTVAFVPLHPYDVKSRPPTNQKEEVFAVNNRNGLTVQRVKFDSDLPIEALKAAPREFSKTYLPPLSRASEPSLQAHQIKYEIAGKGAVGKPAGIPLSFDHKSGSFLMAKQVMQGGKSVTVMAPVSNRNGNLQARGGSFPGGGSSHVSSSGSFHASGGSSGSSGGGSHGSSAGSTTSSSSSASSSSAASSAGAGGHH